MARLAPNKQLERTVTPRYVRAACASLHYAHAARWTVRRAAAQLRRYAAPLRWSVRRALSVFRFTAEVGLGLAVASVSFQLAAANETETHPREIPPALYREPLTQADVSLEWYTYMSFSTFVNAEKAKPGLGIDLAAQQYALGMAEATALVDAVRDVIWEASLERNYLAWLRGDGLGDRINFRRQIEAAPYAVWLRGWCGG